MTKNQLLEIVSANPWQTRISLVKICAPMITGIDAEDQGSFVGGLLSELRESGEIVTAGKARGTRYATKTAKPYAKPKITDAQRKAVLDAVNAGMAKSKDIMARAGVEIDLGRKILVELIKDKKIDTTGSTKSKRYWPLGQAPQAETPKPKTADAPDKKPPPRIKKRPKRAAAKPAVEESKIQDSESAFQVPKDETPAPAVPKTKPIDALRKTFENLPRRSVSRRNGVEIDNNVFTLDEVLRMAVESYGVTRHSLSSLILDHVLGKMGEGHDLDSSVVIHGQMRYAHKRGYPGYSAYVWRPTKDDDPRPPQSMPIGNQPTPAEPKPRAKKKR